MSTSKRFKIASFYTPSYAKVFEECLGASPYLRQTPSGAVNRAIDEVALCVDPLPNDFDTWERACAHKAEFIYDRLLMLPEPTFHMPVLWIDADAKILKPGDMLWYVRKLIDRGVDFAAHYPSPPPSHAGAINSKMLSGTLFFNTTPAAIKLAREWRAGMVKANPNALDQDVLHDAVQRCVASDGLRVENLDPRMVRIYDLMSYVQDPIIEHYQASRTHR